MRSSMRSRFAPLCGVVLLLSLATGCAPAVREDRTITFAPQGNAVGFQHGQEGVFVADKQGGGLTKIFQPGDDVLATSTPLWAPDGKRLVFTTASPAQGGKVQQPRGEPDPAGNIYLQQPVVYTCWLRDAGEPTALFDAACDHVGYVAANLAVRWHPDGNHLLYVKQTEPGQHGLFEFDLKSKTSRSVFAFTATALLFDWAPDQTHLVCVLGSTVNQGPNDGIWVGRPGEADWWHVPPSQALCQGELSSLLEQLRATRPAWTADAQRFAFVSYQPGPAQNQPGHFALHLGDLTKHDVQVLTQGTEPLRDLCWAPDGERLGLLRGAEQTSLHLLRPGGPLAPPLHAGMVRRFAGWSATGERLAYIVPDRIPHAEDARWLFLLVPDPLARDAVYLAEGTGEQPGHSVFSGMRVTFPHWSPDEEKLSVWFTFSPTYRSYLSVVVESLSRGFLHPSLRRGDPAAVFDVKTGTIGWMTVSPQEKVQVGHYHLLKGDYAEAWRWYAEAEREMPPPQPPKDVNTQEAFQALLAPDGTAFFQSYCLTKLGRHDEARAKLEQFHKDFLGRAAGSRELEGVLKMLVPQGGQPLKLEDVLSRRHLFGSLLRDLYLAEAFLSLDASEDGEGFFRQSLENAATDAARLSSALVLSQFLLLHKKHAAYADLAADKLAPLLARLHVAAPAGNGPADWNDLLVTGIGGLALAPTLIADFLAGLPEEQVRALIARWQALEGQARDDLSWQAIDLFLHAAYERLGMEKEKQAIARRFTQEHHGSADLLDGKKMTEVMDKMSREMRTAFPSR